MGQTLDGTYLIQLKTEYGALLSDAVDVNPIVYCQNTMDTFYDFSVGTGDDCTWTFGAGCPNDPLYHEFSEDMAGIYLESGEVVETFVFKNSGEDVNGNFKSYLEADFTFNEATPKGILHYMLDFKHGERGVTLDSAIDKCKKQIIVQQFPLMFF